MAVVALGLSSQHDIGVTALPDNGPLTYVALGDSIASGHGLGTTEGPVEADAAFGQPGANCQRSSGLTAAEKAYPDLVRDALARRGRQVQFHKLACTGHTTADLLTFQLPAAERLLGQSAGVVTLTIGANDYRFSDPVTYVAALNPSPRIYALWRSRIEAGVEANLATALARLGRGHPERRILVTQYYNPFNADSSVYGLVPGCHRPTPTGALGCADRVAGAIEGLNGSILHAVDSYQSERSAGWASAVVVGGVREAFEHHGAPRPNCGSGAPEVEQSWIQSPRRALLVEGLLGEQRLGSGNDCFHPNPGGHRELARLVLARLAVGGRNALSP
ncbi:MAG: GDSL-type esterase/lipase family protein [Acidimicrobiales bacterium]